MIRKKLHIEIPADILAIKDVFKTNGHKLFVVGGAVRDALLHKGPKDFDLATDALPDKVESMLSGHYKTLGTGKAFGVINVFTKSGEFEIATFREDIGSGRRPEAVKFTTIENDVKRRDLTINALFYDIDTEEVVDLAGGIQDLEKGIVRTVGDPQERFGEDRLRILRAIRFAARFGNDLSPETSNAILKDNSLEGISKERIREEFLKGIKSAQSVKFFLELLEQYNLFDQIFPQFKINFDFTDERDEAVVLATLLKGEQPGALTKKLNKLTYTNDEVDRIVFLVSFLEICIDKSFKIKKAFANAKLTHDQVIKFAKINDLNPCIVEAFLRFELSVSGDQLLAEGFKDAALGKEQQRREIENFRAVLEKI